MQNARSRAADQAKSVIVTMQLYQPIRIQLAGFLHMDPW
jgi:hypothetical protein